jgi:hypothetical protein
VANRVLRQSDDGRVIAETPVTSSAGAADAGKVLVLDAAGHVDASAIASGAGDQHYTHSQNVPSDTWVINHNLGKYPSVTILDSANTEWRAEVRHNSVNQAVVYLAFEFSGTAHCN